MLQKREHDWQTIPPGEYSILKAKLKCYGYPSYRAFLRSDHWAKVKETYAQHFPKVCRRCKREGGSHLHHKSYAFLGGELKLSPNEMERELCWLCGHCHKWVHDQWEVRGLHRFTHQSREEIRNELNEAYRKLRQVQTNNSLFN